MAKPSRKLWAPVSRSIWGDSKFRDLSIESKIVFLYILTGPVQGPIPGLFVAGIGRISDELSAAEERFDPDTVRTCLVELRDAKMLRVSSKPPLFFLPNALKHRGSPNSKIVKSWRKAFEELPECPLRDFAMRSHRATLAERVASEDLRSTVLDAFDSVFPEYANPIGNPMGNPMGNPIGCRERERERESIPTRPFGPEHLEVARYLRDGIATHSPKIAKKVRESDLEKWSVEIERAERLDGYSLSFVRRVVRLVHFEDHDAVSFWKSNILSGPTLRSKLGRVRLQAKRAGIPIDDDEAPPEHGRRWHLEHADSLFRLRDFCLQRRIDLTPELLLEKVPEDIRPTSDEASAAVAFLRSRP